MECRTGCGACCIAPSIVQPFYGMPQGKPAGVACVHLSAEKACGLFGDARRPAACTQFQAEVNYCGRDRDEALLILSELEQATLPTHRRPEHRVD
ncbi:MAG: YkgJ family cysteine cluster protein [Gammaproteobacteria bacterium]|jgi:hypothetical protein|nr:YkgJ family cysteine cluster protein [Gammaproteobacteria bacterium]